MSGITIIGVDCACQAKNVGLARGIYGEDGTQVIDVLGGDQVNSVAERISEWVTQSEQSLLAFDAPLGWPTPLGDGLQDHKAGAPLVGEQNGLFRRETDRWVHKHVGKLPLDVGADRIARTAHAALQLLQDVRDLTGQAIPLAWSLDDAPVVSAIEVYPAGTLKMCSLRCTGYKDVQQRTERQRIVQGLRKHIQLPVSTERMVNNDHCLDAVVCVLAGHGFLAGECDGPEHMDTAEREGWIWVRRSCVR